ncbi:hypothetical protein EHM69_00515 [candidate division KSB1 bacterium]|nr:MAG: hypothetical protein EHM69_00515 [candidate division KSB1 bacterium]
MSSKRVNRAREFEGLAKHIFQGMLEQDSVKTLDVKHDVSIKGITTVHQIDVFWRFEMGGVEYSTVVQCKNWSRRVSKGEILEFKGVLDDLPYQPRGIFVARSGYQKGAIEVAEANGIELYELRYPHRKDVEPFARSQGINIPHQGVQISELELVYDKEWDKVEKDRLDISEDKKLSIKETWTADKMILYTETDVQIATVANVLKTFVDFIIVSDAKNFIAKLEHEIPTNIPFDIPFKEPTFIHTHSSEFPRIKINGINGKFTFTSPFDLFQNFFITHVPYVLRRLTNLKPGVDDWKMVSLNQNFDITPKIATNTREGVG